MRKFHRLRSAGIGVALCLTALATKAQSPYATPTLDFQLSFNGSDGTNASAVAWNSKDRIYATVIAGNPDFPLEFFDDKGNSIAYGNAGLDWRGLWYNPANNRFEGNLAGEQGWAMLGMDRNAPADGLQVIKEGQLQPDFQSVGALDPDKKQVVFLDYAFDGVSLYSRKNPKKVKHLNFDWHKSELGNMNTTSVGYTGHKGYEYVLLDVIKGELVFFNREGDQTATSKLPEGAPLSEIFAFSFANDHAFLYNYDTRSWMAYRVW